MAERINVNPFVIEQYLKGELEPKAMHALEEQALNDPFLADALEGYTHTSSATAGISVLQRQLAERIARQQENKNSFNYSWQRLSIAATAAVLCVLAGILFWMRVENSSKQAISSAKQVEVSLTPQSTLQAAPLNGWQAYERYLKERLSKLDARPENGKIIVAFTVDSNGKLSDFKIQKGLSEALNQKVLKVIKEGPKWKPARTATQTQVAIDFSTLF